jgi:hypothetical protein
LNKKRATSSRDLERIVEILGPNQSARILDVDRSQLSRSIRGAERQADALVSGALREAVPAFYYAASAAEREPGGRGFKDSRSSTFEG